MRPRVATRGLSGLATAAALAVLVASGCAGAGRAVRGGAPPPGAEAILGVRHLYVAEEHADPAHHAVQLEVVRFLAGRGVPIAIGVEWLPADRQDAVDRFTSGEIGETAFLREVDWAHTWGHDYGQYRPIFDLARERAIPVLALNAAPGLAREVARHGPEGLSPEHRAKLPPLDSANPEHRAFFDEMMSRAAGAHGGDPHGGGAHGGLDMDRLYLAQLVWDETMSKNAAEWLGSEVGRGRTLVVLAGRGHVLRGLGVPARVARATGLPYVVVVPVKPGAGDEALPPDHLPWPAPFE